MDVAGEDAYLETDKRANVAFYESFGFEVVGEQEVLGLTNRFRFRRAKMGRAGRAQALVDSEATSRS